MVEAKINLKKRFQAHKNTFQILAKHRTSYGRKVCYAHVAILNIIDALIL